MLWGYLYRLRRFHRLLYEYRDCGAETTVGWQAVRRRRGGRSGGSGGSGGVYVVLACDTVGRVSAAGYVVFGLLSVRRYSLPFLVGRQVTAADAAARRSAVAPAHPAVAPARLYRALPHRHRICVAVARAARYAAVLQRRGHGATATAAAVRAPGWRLAVNRDKDLNSIF